EAAVVAQTSAQGEKRLVAYYTARAGAQDAPGPEALRAHLAAALPDYMAPAAFVRLERLPLTQNGKLDRAGLPAPDEASYARRGFEPPCGETERVLAEIWSDLLGVEHVSRNDDFFELGGHSMLAVQMTERLRRRGLRSSVRTIFLHPILSDLAAAVGASNDVTIPPNLIPPGCAAITPQMLPLIQLTQPEIDGIVARVPGGVANVEDIYPLAPLQEGVFFHHLMSREGDAYLLRTLLAFDARARLDAFIGSLQAMTSRYDVLRTAVMWEGLPEPVQVVWRSACIEVEEVSYGPDDGDVKTKMLEHYDPSRIKIDVSRAPMMRVVVAYDGHRWLLLLLHHHLATDHTALEVIEAGVRQSSASGNDSTKAPPFRNFVATTRNPERIKSHADFFAGMLGDVVEPTAPFDLLDVHDNTIEIAEHGQDVEPTLAEKLRIVAKSHKVAPAVISHLAWALVVARASERDDVVFGTMLYGRLHQSTEAENALGMFINSLPLRIRLGGGATVADGLRQTRDLLIKLLEHEQASLALAQRCSSIAPPAPLFTSLLNYRHSRRMGEGLFSGTNSFLKDSDVLYWGERTNYPLTLSIDDYGDDFRLVAQTQSPVEPQRICQYMHAALAGLVAALEAAPATPMDEIEIIPEQERKLILEGFNRTAADYPSELCVHEL
ncbi:condensation domain-containing protein, partial [Methylosinus sp. Sm6]|uniref:condensation domain-containing protein n=1 Tax=Methylosinus sp. Sm6 TaxID=2866948 RepID=UPI001D3A832E